jgi:hypothetical protein
VSFRCCASWKRSATSSRAGENERGKHTHRFVALPFCCTTGLWYETRSFAKTGSGQAQAKHKNQAGVLLSFPFLFRSVR